MSSSTPRLLINREELNEIWRIMLSARKPKHKMVGGLYGLWRNSLRQPVIELITGPGKYINQSDKAKNHDYKFDKDYHEFITKYLNEEHGLMQIGLWCSGKANSYPSCK